jgi:hypothetical protein
MDVLRRCGVDGDDGSVARRNGMTCETCCNMGRMSRILLCCVDMDDVMPVGCGETCPMWDERVGTDGRP